jgi:hypothetical protein
MSTTVGSDEPAKADDSEPTMAEDSEPAIETEDSEPNIKAEDSEPTKAEDSEPAKADDSSVGVSNKIIEADKRLGVDHTNDQTEEPPSDVNTAREIERNVEASNSDAVFPKNAHRFDAHELDPENVTKVFEASLNLNDLKNQELCVFAAIRSGHIEDLKHDLSEVNVDLDRRDSRNRTCADFAAIMGRLDMVQLILEKGGTFGVFARSVMMPLARERARERDDSEPRNADDNSTGVSVNESGPTQRTSRGDTNSNRTPAVDSTESFEKEGNEDSEPMKAEDSEPTIKAEDSEPAIGSSRVRFQGLPQHLASSSETCEKEDHEDSEPARNWTFFGEKEGNEDSEPTNAEDSEPTKAEDSEPTTKAEDSEPTKADNSEPTTFEKEGTEDSVNRNVIRVGTFMINGEIKHFAVVPPILIRSQPDMQDLVSYWGLPTPNFILETNESNEQRERVLSAENASSVLKDIFQRDKAETAEPENEENADATETDASESNSSGVPPLPSRQKPTRGISMLQEQKRLSPNDWLFVSKYLRRKLIQALSSIVTAADLTNGWILCHGAPSSNEKMLEVAIDRTGSRPTVLVVDDLAGYTKKEWVGDKVKKLLTRLEKAGTPLNLLANDGDEQRKEEPIEFEVFDNYDIDERRGEVHTESGKVDNESGKGKHSLWGCTREGGSKSGWFGHFPWKCGTHYIFSSGMEHFEPSLLGPAGYLCMNGHEGPSEYISQQPKRTGYMIREAMTTVKPCILFNNTGAETQMYARLIEEIKKIDQAKMIEHEQARRSEPRGFLRLTQNKTNNVNGPTSEYYSDLKTFLRQDTWELWEHAVGGHAGEAKVENSEGKRGVLSLADVVQIIDLYCDNPRLFQKIVVSVNPFDDTPDAIVQAVTLSFARSIMESREVGAGDADKKAVVQGWRFHFQLETSKCSRVNTEVTTSPTHPNLFLRLRIE